MTMAFPSGNETSVSLRSPAVGFMAEGRITLLAGMEDEVGFGSSEAKWLPICGSTSDGQGGRPDSRQTLYKDSWRDSGELTSLCRQSLKCL